MINDDLSRVSYMDATMMNREMEVSALVLVSNVTLLS
jgi:hypothetical protein